MKKIKNLWVIVMVLFSMLVIDISLAGSIDIHEKNDGFTYGEILYGSNTSVILMESFSHINSGNVVYAYSSSDCKAQTFTVGNTGENLSFNISKIQLRLGNKKGNPGNIMVNIMAVDGSGKPTGGNLSSGSIDSNMVSTESFGWVDIEMSDYEFVADTQYAIVVYCSEGNAVGDPDGVGLECYYLGGYTGGKAWSGYPSWVISPAYWANIGGVTNDINFRVYSRLDRMNITRTCFSVTEVNNFTYTISNRNYSDNVKFKVPVSNQVVGVVDVTNNTCGSTASEVNNLASVVNNSFYFDASNHFVYIGTINLTIGMVVNWTVNCSYGANFSIDIPDYLEVGDYLIMQGLIENSTDRPIDGLVAQTFIYYSNGAIAKGSDPTIKWNCTDGNYQATISTNSLIPGIYTVEIEFTETSSGITFRYGDTLYLSYDTPTGVYSDAVVYFNFYNTNVGLGLPRETLKLYIDNQRLYNNFYYTYTGNEINVTVKDYYNTTLYQNNFTIDNTRTFLDLGLTFHSYLFGNKNDDYYMVSLLKQGGTRWWERGIVPYGEREFLIPSGDYMMRIYDKDDTEVYNTSAYNPITNSRVYVIHGTNLSLIIDGQSTITGQLLELQNELDTALMPDAVIWATNPVTIFSCFDRIGQNLGNSIWKVCPPLNTIATTRVQTTGNWINSTPTIPGNDTTENGTITVIQDTMYISGNNSVNWVNITYTDNGTLMQNTTYIPNKLNLNGENLTINASCDIHILREIIYKQSKKFYWDIYNSTINPGYISGRAGYHQAGITIDNPLCVPIYDVYIYAGFSDKTTPDLNTVRVNDIENGVLLERGEDFKATNGIEFKIEGGIPADTDREFTLSYYKDKAHTYYYEDEQTVVYRYKEQETLSGYDEFYNMAEIMWVNDNTLAFRGSLRIKFSFDVDLDRDSVKVFDMDYNQLVDDDNIIVGDEFIWISNNVMGTVASGGMRNFEIYFQEQTYPGQSVDEYHLSTPYFKLSGFPVSVFSILIVFCLVIIGIGLIQIIKSKKLKDRYLFFVLLGVFLSMLFWVLQAKGV